MNTHTIPPNNPLSPVSMRATANCAWPTVNLEPTWFRAVSIELANALKELEEDLPIYGLWEAVDKAPSDYPGIVRYMDETLKLQMQMCKYPVWNGACENTIYETPEDNHRFRVIHDYHHYKLQKGFSTEDEIYVSKYIGQLLKDIGVSRRALELYNADTIGQSLYKDATGSFPENQRQFAIDSLANLGGLDHE
jgi:hypothetical protein